VGCRQFARTTRAARPTLIDRRVGAVRYVSDVAPLPDLSLADWVVLGVVAEGPTHGWPIVRTLRTDGELGRVWTVRRPIVYRSLATLTDRGFIEESGTTDESRGPKRTIVRVTRSGRAALKRWLGTPVEHVRDVRTEFLVKLALLDRAARSPGELVERQIAHLEPVIRAVSTAPAGEGFDLALARWRREQALAVDRFLRSLVQTATP
jgi:DNA-binding PadR family transcriptional regulator